MWDLPRPGIEPVSHTLAGEFLTTGPPGKSLFFKSTSFGENDRQRVEMEQGKSENDRELLDKSMGYRMVTWIGLGWLL